MEGLVALERLCSLPLSFALRESSDSKSAPPEEAVLLITEAPENGAEETNDTRASFVTLDVLPSRIALAIIGVDSYCPGPVSYTHLTLPTKA